VVPVFVEGRNSMKSLVRKVEKVGERVGRKVGASLKRT
jgi:hypothetical protein